MKNKIIAGNWKMNKTVAQTKTFFKELLPLVKDCANTVIVCVPFTDIANAVRLTKGSNVAIGAQNVHFKSNGAYTGEISAEMLAETGAQYVIIGHSERRSYYNETNAAVCAKITAALNAALTPIVCVGETGEQRNANLTESVLAQQINEGFNGISAQQAAKTIIAYEPVWAIGTGVTATSAQAEQAIAYIRVLFVKLYGEQIANQLYIQYGGSMNEGNAAELLSQPNIDGGLIGGASLVPVKFAAICKAK